MRGAAHTARADRHREWLLPTIIKLSVAALVLAGAWGVYRQIGTDDRIHKRLSQRISIVSQPPARKVEPKPPEQEAKEEVPLERLELKAPQQANAPVDDALGVDEEGAAGGDAFGLAAKKGGRDIILLGNQTNDRPAGEVRINFAMYTGSIQQQLQSEFNKNDKLRRGSYRVQLKLWIARDGGIERFELLDSTGVPELDRTIELALGELPRLDRPPPPEMPQPVRIRLTSREAL